MVADFMSSSLVTLSLFWCSVVVMRFAQGLSYMFRKVLHSTMQIATVVFAYATSVPFIFTTSVDEPVRYAAATVSFGIIPIVLLTRGTLKRFHTQVGRLGLLSYSALVFALAIFHTHTHRVSASVLLGLCIFYSVAAFAHPSPSVSRLITRDPDGTYTVQRKCDRVVLVGGGWSSYLNRTLVATELSTRTLTGEYSTNNWGAGTSISTVQRTLRGRKQTLSSHPCIMRATLGGWVFTAAHGSGGQNTRPSIRSVTLYDCESASVTKHTYPCDHILPPNAKADALRRYIVLEVEVIPVEDVVCHLRVTDILEESNVHDFMYDDTLLSRMIFLDKASVLSVVWSRLRRSEARTFGVGRVVPVWLSSIGPRFFSCIRRSDWSRSSTLSVANHFAPDPPYYSGLVARFFTNFELYVRPVPTSLVLWTLVKGLQRLFGDRYPLARCEVRIEQHTLFLDFSIFNTSDTCAIESLVRTILKPRSLHFHRGKFVPLTIV